MSLLVTAVEVFDGLFFKFLSGPKELAKGEATASLTGCHVICMGFTDSLGSPPRRLPLPSFPVPRPEGGGRGGRCWGRSPCTGTMRTIQHDNIVQKLCPEGVRGPRLHNKSEKHVWGRRPRTFLTLFLVNLGPGPLWTQLLRNLNILNYRIVPGVAQLPG